MGDPDVDMEELEARLYGQVHHAANEDEEPSSYRPPAGGAEPPGKRFDRYFENSTSQAPFPSGNIQYQSPLNLNPNPSFFQSNHNLFNTPANFYKNFRLVPLSDLVLNPAVNNIVVFPPPPTQIFTQQNPPEWKMTKRMQNMMNKKERYLERRREKRKRKKLEKKNKFREHYMMQPPQRTGLLESNGNEIEMKMSERSGEVICLSESNSSDCEAIHSEKDESVVILSSDDESKICEQSIAEVKCENSNANGKVNINNDAKPQRAVETCIDNNKKSKPEPSDVAFTEDDEVIFVEPAGRQEVIIIDCEDSQMFPVKKAAVVSRETIIQERRELLDTPESTNDFLDGTLTLNKNNEDDLNTTEQRADLDTCETESSCSTNDCETPSRSAIFNEGVFDSPSKGLSELNFESFTNYIATKAKPNRIPSILTPVKSAAALRADKSNNSRANSSDSSSESDYEDSKSAYVDKRKRVNMKKKPQNKKDPLPNLSPITSEEELNLTDLTNDKSKFSQKKEKTSKSSRNKKAPLTNLSLITSDDELDLADLTSGKSESPQKKEKKSKSNRNKKSPLPNLSPITSDEDLDITDSKSSQKKEKKSKSSRNKKAPLPNLSPITSDEDLDITDSKSSQKKQKTSKSSPRQQSVEQPAKQLRAEKRKSDTRKNPEPSKKPRENSKADLMQQEAMEGSDSESSEDSVSMESPEPSKKSRQNKEKSSADSMRQDSETIEDSDSMKSPAPSKKSRQNKEKSLADSMRQDSETIEDSDSMKSPAPSKKSRQHKEKSSADSMRQDSEAIEDSDSMKSPAPSKKSRQNKEKSSADSMRQDSETIEDSDSMKSPEPSKKSRQNKEKSSADSMRQDSETIEDSDSMKSPKKPQRNVDNLSPDLIQQDIVGELDPETSESDSDVEIVPASNLDSRGSDLELLNVEADSSPINVPQEKTNTKLKRFSDYWTDDMKKFYFETWNDENFSVEEEQRKMTDDPKCWKIIARDRVNVNLQPKGPRCHRCREFGHKSHNCKKKIEPPKCILCGARGHLEARCPNKVCTSCGRRSLYSTTYCSRCADSRYARCKICLVRGHTTSNCTDLWRCYHLTTRNGPIVLPINTNQKASRDRWCSGCASRGHFEHDCNYYNRTHPLVNPFILSYSNVSDNIDASCGLQRQMNTRIVFPEDDEHCHDEFFPFSALNNTYAAQAQSGGEENYSNNTRPPMTIPRNLNSVQVYHNDQDFAPNVQPPRLYQELNNKFFSNRRMTMQNVKQMITFLESSHICWTQLAIWYYTHVQNLQEDKKNAMDQRMKRKLERLLDSDYANLNAMILVKLQVARGAKHMKILKQWIAEGKRNSVSKTCGRRSQYSTTSCSRCANYRYARCKICLVRSHTSSYCTDLWRRYHLTIRDGPVIQPINTHMKAWKDQWCSGCACRGHLEHDCNYYNRTHPPTSPYIHSYNDVHDSNIASRGLEWQKTDNGGIAPREVTDRRNEKHGSDEFLPLDSSYATQTQRGGGENYLNNIGPLMSTPINLSSLQIYPYNQAFAPNVLQSNFYQQFPVGHQFVPSNTTSDSSPAQNAQTMISHAEAIVEDFGVASNNSDQQSQNSNKCNTVEVWRTKKYASKLLQEDGAQFLKVLGKQSNVKITVGEQKWNNNLRYVCMFEGQADQIPQADDAIDRYLSILYDRGSMKKKFTFFKKINNLKENIQLLENPLRPWINMANSVYDKLKSITNNMNIEKNPKRKLQLESKVKKQYTVLNAMILGKLKIADGPRHMSILKQWTTEGDKKTVVRSYDSVYPSFIYIFKNESHLNINYKDVIKTFYSDKRLKIKMETKTMLDSGISLCQMRNWTDALNGHKDLFNLVIINNYSIESFSKFKNNFKSSIEFAKKHKKSKKSNKRKKKLSSVS